MKQHFNMFAHYNRWANGRLYDAVRHLDDDGFHRDMGAFFGSVCGTLNHILVADLIWLSRFTGEGEAPDALDIVLYESLEELRDARMKEDERIVAFIERLDNAEIAANFRYRGVTKTIVVEQPLGSALAHFFN
ncbi:MAG: DinB family protein, partial [Hyphomicrobiales bacterium]|nr:DinB family protein [Hyphomicrobiales bacterium]